MTAAFPFIKAQLSGPIPDLILATWQDIAGAELGHDSEYVRDASYEKMVPYHGNELSCAIANTHELAAIIELGHGGRHAPSTTDWGAAVARGTAKLSARGVPYLRIPFRHGTPGGESGGLSARRTKSMIPDDVYRRDVLGLAKADRQRRAALLDSIREAGRRLSRPYEIMSGNPRRGLNLRDLTLQSLMATGTPGYTWKTTHLAGLTGKTQVNPVTGRKSTAWMTFRTMTADSLGWWIPPQPGRHFAARVVDAVTPAIRELIAEAARDDVVSLINAEIGGRA